MPQKYGMRKRIRYEIEANMYCRLTAWGLSIANARATDVGQIPQPTRPKNPIQIMYSQPKPIPSTLPFTVGSNPTVPISR